MNMLLRTNDSWSKLIIRVGLAVVMFPHGAQKVLGWYGGPGLKQTMSIFTTQMHIPAFLVVLVIAAEFLAPIGLLIGFLSRIAAFGILCDMVGAVALVHAKNGFFMNWMGNQAGEGFEYHLLAIAMSLAIVIGGAGHWSVERAVTARAKAAGKLD